MNQYHQNRPDSIRPRLQIQALALLIMLAAIGAGAADASGSGTLPVSPIYLRATSAYNGLQVEPATITYTGDGSGFLGGANARDRNAGIKWSEWTDAIALGTGFKQLNDCNPNCARGTFHGFSVKIELWRPRSLAGTLVFTRMTIFYTNQRPPREPRHHYTFTDTYRGGYGWSPPNAEGYCVNTYGLPPAPGCGNIDSLPPALPVGSGCPAYGVVDSRGSGEPQGKLSPPAAAVLAEVQARHRGERVADYWNPYPAVGLTDSPREWVNALGAAHHVGPLGAYHGSVVDGERWLQAFIPRELRTCPTIKMVLVGYSQGAQVTGDVYQRDVARTAKRNILAVLLFGDPYFNPSDRQADRRSHEQHRSGALGKRPTFGSDPRVESFCHHHDPVCQASGHPADFLLWRFKQHENYPPDAKDAASHL